MKTAIDFTYETKCRRCGNISDNYVSNSEQMNFSDFTTGMSEKSTFPISKQCKCSNGRMMFHDVISYSPVYLV